MRRVVVLLRLIVAVMILASATMAAAMAPMADCTAMTSAAMMTMAGDEPELAPQCDIACVACLVQPVAVEAASVARWSIAAGYPPKLSRLEDFLSPPDLPPPRRHAG